MFVAMVSIATRKGQRSLAMYPSLPLLDLANRVSGEVAR